MRALFLVSLVACSSSSARGADLMNDVRTFQEGIRWQKHEMSADYVPAAPRERFRDAHEEIDKDLRIDDYEIQRVKAEASGNDAYVRMKYTWHLDSVGTVHETTTEQHWELQGKIWRI